MFSDLRLIARTLRKSPGFVVVALLTLTLGIGVNTAMFGIVNALLLRGLPFPAEDRLYFLHGRHLKRGGLSEVSDLDLADFRAQQRTFESLAAYHVRGFNFASAGSDPEWVIGTQISANGPTLLRVPAALGRWFQPGEDEPGAAPVIVIGYALWHNRFQGDRAVLGRSVKVNGEWATLVGVAPKDFRFPQFSDAWMPLRPKRDDTRDVRTLDVFGRLVDHATPAQAQVEFAAIAQRLAAAHPETNEDCGTLLTPLHHEFLDENTRQLVFVMFGAVGLVLLIACANVANLLLARAAGREKEIAIRTALGATRGQLVRLLLTETLVLSLGGAAFGLPLAYGLMAALNAHLSTRTIPYWMVLDIDRWGIVYVVGLAALTCLIAGLWPAWRVSRVDPHSALKDGGRGSTGFSLSRFSRMMVIGEVVLSTVLLVLSALTIRSVVNAESATLGYRTAGVFTSRITFNGAAYDKSTARLNLLNEFTLRLARRPEIEAVALATRLPTQGDRVRVVAENEPRDGARTTGRLADLASPTAVSGSYFATLDIRFLSGRTFDDRDADKAPRVAIVSAPFAALHWPHDNAIGQRFAFGERDNVQPGDWMTVVGVVSGTQGPFQRDMLGVTQVYTPLAQAGGDTRTTSVFTRVRGAGDPAALAQVVRQELRALDPEQPIYVPITLETAVANAWFFKGLLAWIFGIFGAVALVLAAVGLYGVMSYSVSQRTQEIGVRMALGAEPRDVLALILREGGLRLGVGLAIGLVAAYFAGRLLAFTLYGVEPGDGRAFGSVLLVLGATGLIACLVPALRAVRVNPVEALRQD